MGNPRLIRGIARVIVALVCVTAQARVHAQTNIVVPVQIVRVADDDGGRQTPLSTEEAAYWLAFANQAYTVANITFTFDPLADFTTIRSTLLNNTTGTMDTDWDAERIYGNQVSACFPGKLVLFARFGPTTNPSAENGFSWWDYDFAAVPALIDQYHCGTWNMPLMAHEIGHHLGLPHTFSALFDTTNAAAADFASKGNNPAVYDGDGFSDTPPHPSIRTEECPPDANILVLNGVTFTLPRNNIMSYYFEANTFSPQQANRLRWMASNYQRNNMRRPVNFNAPNPQEGESLSVVQSQNATYFPQDMTGFGADGWSGHEQIFAILTNGSSLTVQFNCAKAGNWRLDLYLTQAPDYGIFQCAVDGVSFGPPVDGYAPLVIPSGQVSLGTLNLTAGNHLLKFQMTAKNAASSNYYFGLDCLSLVDTNAVVSPTVTTQPLSQSVDAGSAIALRATAAGASTFTYQWRRESTNVPGATASSYPISPATVADSGNYSVVIGNGAGSVTSMVASVTVNPTPSSPFRIEGENAAVDVPENVNGYGPQNMTGFGTGWSGNAQLFIDFNPGGNLTLPVEVAAEGFYRVEVAVTKAPDFGQVQCSLDGVVAGPVVDGYGTSVLPPNGRVSLGIFYLSFGLHSLRFQCVGKDSVSAGYRFGIDYIEVTARSPQVLQSPAKPAGGGFQFLFGDSDGTGSSLSNASHFTVETSTNLGLGNWTSSAGHLLLTNGTFLWMSSDPAGSLRRYFRVVEK